jgi:hypothetical protein
VLPRQENVIGMVNMDMILRPAWDLDSTQPIDLDLGTRTAHTASVVWANKFRQAAHTYVPTLPVDNNTFNVNGGSDQHPFAENGIPAFLAIENTAQEIWGGSANVYYHGYQDASDRLANSPSSPSGVTYDYPFATNVVRTVVALLAQEAGLILPTDSCDFDTNGLCNVLDLNALLQTGPIINGVAVVPGVTDQFDLNGDNSIDNVDVDEWLASAATANGFGSPYKRGDANLDGVVDGVDFSQWNERKFTSNLLWDGGDFNGDGTADGIDFTLWNAHKFTSSAAFRTSVPEPAAAWLVWALWVPVWCRRRKVG